MQNVGTGEWIRYDNENGRQMFPIDDESKKSPIDFAPDTLDGVPYSRMSITDGRSFCPSAQWCAYNLIRAAMSPIRSLQGTGRTVWRSFPEISWQRSTSTLPQSG
jgi:hypothetical protein